MDKLDHAKTSSYKNSKAAQAYREEIKQMINNGNMRGAMAREIKDVRRFSGTKYNSAIKEMLNYSKNAGYLGR